MADALLRASTISSSPRPLLLLLLVLSSSSLFLQSPVLPSRAEDAGDFVASLDPPVDKYSNPTATLLIKSNSTKGPHVKYPAVSLSLSLGIAQELNANPFVHPNPMLSLSLSLSVSEELRGNPFDLMNLLPPIPQPEADQEDRPRQQQQQKQEEEEEEERRRQQAEVEPRQLQLIRPKNVSQLANSSSTAVGRGKCAYTVSIKTSCFSPRATRDAVSLSFGDASRNEVYAARLDDPASGTFGRCSIDTFRVVGPCGSRTCYLYLRRSGRDGWTPEYAKVYYNLNGDARAFVTFPYDAPLPNGFWYGFNLCHDGATALPDRAGAGIRPAAASRATKSEGEKDGEDGGGLNNDDDDRGDPTINLKTKVGGSVKTVIFRI